MADTQFFEYQGPQRLAAIAARAGCLLPEGIEENRLIHDVAPLETAGPPHLSFLDNPKYRAAFQTSKAGVCFVRDKEAPLAPPGMIVLRSPYPYKAYARAAQLFYRDPAPEPGVHPRAFVDASATLGAGCSVAPGAVVEAGAVLGPRCQIAANAVIGRGVILGEETVVGAGASISHAQVGARVVIYPGARIGQPGFGFAFDAERPVKVPQLGRVLIEDDVEIGANSTLDRGAGPDTIIGRGTMIDNGVQIAHNVVLGRGCIVAAHTGISGSTHVGDYVMMGGKAGLTGHLQIGSGAKIAANSGVMRDVSAGEAVGGSPAFPMREWLRQQAALRKLAARG